MKINEYNLIDIKLLYINPDNITSYFGTICQNISILKSYTEGTEEHREPWSF